MLTRGIALWHNCGLLLSRGRSIHGVSVCGGGIDDDLNAIDGQWTWTVFPRINIFMSFRQMVRIHVQSLSTYTWQTAISHLKSRFTLNSFLTSTSSWE